METDYGLDAPNVVRNLFIFSALADSLAILSCLIEDPFWFWASFLYFGIAGSILSICVFWMVYSSRVGKPKLVKKLIEELNLAKGEKILDIGCGSGLLLIESAKRVGNGNAHGVDLWQKKDQSGNEMERTLKNAQLEGVEVKVQTSDIRTLPFENGTFDAVVSSLVIHNIPAEKGREKALSEMIRVLKPGGRFFLLDIHYGKKYAEFLNKQGITVTCSTSGYLYCMPLRVIKNSEKS